MLLDDIVQQIIFWPCVAHASRCFRHIHTALVGVLCCHLIIIDNHAKSGSYINGMLDSIARYLIDTGKLLKSMAPRQQRFVHVDKKEKDDVSESAETPESPTSEE